VAIIHEAELERLKADVVGAAGRGQGVELKLHRVNMLGRCPFHDDRTPSLVISPETFGSSWARARRGPSSLVMRPEGASLRHAHLSTSRRARPGGRASLKV